jgi:hypothetical protein
MIRDTDGATFGIDIGLAEGFLDGAQVSAVQLKAFSSPRPPSPRARASKCAK